MKLSVLRQLYMISKYCAYGLIIQCIVGTSLLASREATAQRQSIEEIQISIAAQSKRLADILDQIAESTDFEFALNNKKVNLDKKIELETYQGSLGTILRQISNKAEIGFRRVNNNIFIRNITKEDEDSQGKLVEEFVDVDISGKITDENGEGLPGASVIEKGTTNGTTTDLDGQYKLTLPENATLVVSFLGYKTAEIELAGRSTIDFQMELDAEQLEEVVVIGYGVQERSTLAGSIATMDAKDFESRPVTNAVNMLQGTVPGLIVTQTSSQPGNEGLALQLRGLSSINGGNTPLVLVDGLQSSFSTLNPDDIENISVVKDAAAAIYGNQAANGVVLITTKKGKKNSSPVINYSFNYGRNTPSYTVEKFTTREYMEVVNEGFVNDGAAPLYGDIFFEALGTDQALNFNQTRLGGAEREDSWLVFNQSHNQFVDEFFETGIRQNHNLGISGGSNNSTYRLSFGYLNENGLVNSKFDGYRRYNVRLNNTFDITKRLSLSTQNALEIGIRSASTQLDAALSRIGSNWTLAPVRRTDGKYYTFRGFLNALDLLDQGGENKRNSMRLISNAKLEYQITDELFATGNVGINRNQIQGRSEVPTIYLINEWTIDDTPGSRIVGGTNPNRLIETNESESYANINGFLTYDKVFSDEHNLTVTGGFSHEQRRDNLIRSEIRNFPTNDLFSLAIGDLDEARVGAEGYAWTLRSWFGRINYAFKDRYIVEANIRYDGSSRFTPEKRWGAFSGYLMAWRASEETFIKNMDFFDNLKFRVSYGETGNQQGIGFYDYLSLINIGGRTIFGPPSGGMFGLQAESQTYAEAGAVSLDRSWETVATTNFGVDIGVLDSRLNFSFDYYIKRNKDLLVSVDVPTVLGLAAPALNKGEMETKGWELAARWNSSLGEFKYSVNATLFNDKNKLISLEGSEGVKSQGVNNRLVGYSVGTYFGWKFDGIIQNQEELDTYTTAVTSGLPGAISIGDVRYVDVDGNGELSALGNPANGDTGDLVELGNIRPQYSFSLDLGGEYKGFDFRVLFQGVAKRTIFRGGVFSAPIEAGSWFNQGARYFYGKTWTPDNIDAKFGKLSVNSGINNYNYRPSVNNKVNAAYARLKNLQLGYSFSSDILSKIKVSKLRIFLSGENLFELQSSLSRELNFDPEAGTGSVAYPFARTYSVGAQITF